MSLMKRTKALKASIAAILTAAMCMSALPATVVMATTVTPDQDYRFYMIPNAHIDTAWTWPIEHTAEVVIRDTYERQIANLNSNPAYKFTTSASVHYQWCKEYYPTDYIQVKKLATTPFNDPQWGIAGGQVVEPDLNAPSGEAFARQGLEAQWYFYKELGRMANVAYVPDVFGFTGNMPQFFRKTGMQSFIATKLNWRSDPGNGALDPGPWAESSNGQSGNSRESDLFWWEAMDGSDVLAYNCMSDYTSSYSSGNLTSTTMTSNVFGRLRYSGSVSANTIAGAQNGGTYYYNWDSGIRYAVGMFGSGDHGGGPAAGTGSGQIGWPAALDASVPSTVVEANISNYFDALRGKEVSMTGDTVNAVPNAPNVVAADGLNNVYKHVGENYLAYHRGTYTSWSRQKKYNRQGEIKLETAEKAATLAFWANTLDNNSSDKINIGWNRNSVNQMHDIQPGSASPPVYYQAFANHELVNNLTNSVQSNALLALAYRADTSSASAGVPIFVYNALSWQRDGDTSTTVTLDRHYNYVKVVDSATGDELKADVAVNKDNTAKVSFIAKGVPSLGYKVFYAIGSDTPPAAQTDLAVTDSGNLITVSNSVLKFTIDKTTGNMPSLITLADGHETFKQDAGIQGNALQWKVDTGGGSYPAWDMTSGEFMSPATAFNTVNTVAAPVKVIENTPEKITVRVTQTILDPTDGAPYNTTPSTITRDITLYSGSDKVDVHLALDWEMYQRNLKVAFPVAVDTTGASYEEAYGAMDASKEAARQIAQAALLPSDTSATGPLLSSMASGIPPWEGALGRSTLRDTRWNQTRFEQSGHKWMDVSDDSTVDQHGMSILNDAKYGYDVLRMTPNGATGTGTDAGIASGSTYVRARLTVVRSPISSSETQEGSIYQPSSQVIDLGPQDFNYAIYPHSGTWKTAETSNRAHELCYPMPSFQTAAHASNDPTGKMGKQASFMSTNTKDVIIGAVKNYVLDQTDKNTMVIRCWETTGKDNVPVTVTLPSNVVSAREVNMLEVPYGDHSDVNNRVTTWPIPAGTNMDTIFLGYNDNLDNGVTNYNKIVEKPIKLNGDNTISFNMNHYEITTIKLTLAPYAGAQVQLKQSPVSLAGLFDLKGTSPNSAKTAGNLDGAGDTIPAELWNPVLDSDITVPGPTTVTPDYNGVKFTLGPADGNNFVSCNGETVPVNAPGSNKIYILGCGVSNAQNGTFTVNYADGTTKAQDISFAYWKSMLTGWSPLDKADVNPYVYDSIAQVFSHWHNGVKDMQTLDNFLYVYTIDVDPGKTIQNITLPQNTNMKLAAMTAVYSPISGFGFTNENFVQSDDEYYWNFSDQIAGYSIGTPADKLNITGPTEPVGRADFVAVTASGTPGNSGEGPTNLLKDDSGSKWCNNNTTAANAWFVFDAGAPVKYPGYVIRGANDDMSYNSRVPSAWTIYGSNDPNGGSDGTWNTAAVVAQQSGQGTITSNYQLKLFSFTPGAIPDSGYRYYRFVITSTGAGNGTALGTGNTTVQFSYLGLYTALQENGSLNATVVNDVTKAGNTVTIATVNGPNVVDLSGTVAASAVAPVSAMSYISLKKGLNVKINDDTKLGFMINPKDAVSSHISVDLKFTDGTQLRNLGAVDQYGIGLNPKALGDGGKIIPGQWNYEEAALGPVAKGKIVSDILFGFQADGLSPGTPVDGTLDNVSIFRGEPSYPDVKVNAGLYTADGTLVSVSSSDVVSVHSNTTVALKPTIVLDASHAGANFYVKTFLWTPDTFMPVADANIIPFGAYPSNSTAENASIAYAAADANNAKFTANYTYNSPDGMTEGATQFAWYKKVGLNYSLIRGATGKVLQLTNTDVRAMDAVRCVITVIDSNGDQGKSTTADLAVYTSELVGGTVVYETTANGTAKYLIDGDVSDANKWDAPTDPAYSGYQGPPPVIAVLQTPGGIIKNISQIQVWNANSDPNGQAYDQDPRAATYDFDISYSSDNAPWTSDAALNWTTIQIRGNTDPVRVINLGGPVPVRYVKITVITPNNGGDTWDVGVKSVRILELQGNSCIID